MTTIPLKGEEPIKCNLGFVFSAFRPSFTLHLCTSLDGFNMHSFSSILVVVLVSIRQAEKDGEVNLVHCSSDQQIADILTKALPKGKFEVLRAMLGEVQRLQARYDGYGALCYDPRFVGSDGVMLYFHGAKETDFSIFSDDNLHINAHLIGTQPQGRNWDFTWVQTFSGIGTVRQLMSRRMEMQNRVFNTAERSVVVKRTDDLDIAKVTVSTLVQLNVKLVPIGVIYLHAANGTLLKLISPSNETNSTASQLYQRAILEYEGVFRHYVYPKRSSSGRLMAWSSLRSIPGNICLHLPQHLDTGRVACGFNSLCSIGTDRRQRFYKAILNDENGKIVDVKKLQKTVTEGEQGFLAEVNSISRNNHKNLVQLLGFCNEGQHRLLVYEHMETGSLADLLFKDSRLSWLRRPQNVLLDEGLTATIAGFGIAKLMRKDQTRTTTKIRGIRGYAAPEWFRNMPITVKVDVYSFGILLLELICCRKSYKQDVANENEMILAEWVCDCYRRKELHLLAGDDEEPIEDIKRFEKLLMVAIWCIQENPALRPRMKKVMLTLEGSVEVSIHPDPFSFI
ncbi:putative G-type lectin S-receptor-like serine/threonine-protein kinase RLK1-like [Capsicum annuum]|nr:putative G-type lectin S-receptor-like serine/threonine-protein kinase RLK1-like [Capsicum annuum]